MAIRIEAKAGHRLQLSGDIETVLDVSAGRIVEGFSLAFSDGTLVLGRWIPGGHACRFGIVNEGTLTIRITPHGLGEALDLDGNIARITLSGGTQTQQPEAKAGEEQVPQVTLDIELREDA
ncbi:MULTISPECIES: hypothetical protein [unclassified Novosphingobium]|uniref:hypothetical protein n=1 Tax=unclassified Novosphingobium TaxID=2644732 RepID=UPI00146BD689|nr:MULTISPECIES: hypothetical protein [unclassified Novosphingobium]NMN02958.1 hypothetical protein [Novosphingobium sp. SG919]NMN87055.1 hypothetical protein [Novosphingobium sp. SG916]